MKKKRLVGLKLFIASLSLSSLIGLFNLLLKPLQETDNTDQGEPDMDDLKNLVNAPFPTIAPELEGSQNASQLEVRANEDLAAAPAGEPAAPEIEIVTIGGGSTGGSGNSTVTSSSR